MKKVRFMPTVQATYFGEKDDASLCGLFHPAACEKQKDEAVLICYPAPQEVFKTYYVQRSLAIELAQQGFACLRFDYYGTGDSYGNMEEADITRWLRDIQQAYKFLRRKTRTQKVHVFATRLGCLLAAKALEQENIQTMIFWDPIANGQEYLSQINMLHQSLVTRRRYRPPFLHRSNLDSQAVGSALTKVMMDELFQLEFVVPQRLKALHLITNNPADASVQGLRSSCEESLGDFCIHPIADNMGWQDVASFGLQGFPQQLVRSTKAILTEHGI